jgi:hypothetical protein
LSRGGHGNEEVKNKLPGATVWSAQEAMDKISQHFSGNVALLLKQYCIVKKCKAKNMFFNIS